MLGGVDGLMWPVWLGLFLSGRTPLEYLRTETGKLTDYSHSAG